MSNKKIKGLIDFEGLKKLYEHKKEIYGINAYKYISELMREAKEIHKEVWQQARPKGNHDQSWRSFKGSNLEKLIKYIVIDEVNSLGLKIINGKSLDKTKLSSELDKVKRNLVINYGIFGMHLPDADLVVYNPENYDDMIIISIKSSMRDRVAQTGYWKLKLKESKNTEHILVYFITLDEDRVLNESKVCRKPRAIVEVDTDNCYVLTEESIQVSNVVKNFDQLIIDLEAWFTQRKNKS